MKKFTRGFTLIELLVVIAIIGILASIVLVSLNGARKKGSDARIISDVQEIRTALETGYNGSGYSDLVAIANCNGTTNAVNAVLNTNAALNGCVAPAGPDNTNISTLANDALSQGGFIYLDENAGSPVNGYTLRGQLSSNNKGDFCIDSTGKTDGSEPFGTPNTNAAVVGCQ